VNVEEVSGPPPETAATGSPMRTTAEVSCLAFTADGTRCLVASGDALELRELESGKLVRSFEQPGKVRAIAVPDAKTAITCDEEGDLVRWNLTTGERERAKEVVARVAACVPDMERVLVGDAQGVSEVWDYAVTPWKKVTREPLEPSGGVTALAISRTGRALVGSAHGFVWAVNLLESDKHATLVVDHGKPILAVGFSKDAKHAIVATEDEVRFFTAGGATLERRLGLPGKPAAAVVLPSQGDHALVLAADGGLRLVDLTTARGASPLDLSAAPYDRASAAAFSRDGRSFLVGTKNGLVLRFEITGK